MEMMVLDTSAQERLIQERRHSGDDRYDEVWDGVYIVSPLPNTEHQWIIQRFCFAFETTIGETGLGMVLPGANVSDLDDQWEHNHRSPDVVVFLNENNARDLGTHWIGGPDFAVEVISRNDRSREKLDYYAKLGTREVLLVDRFPWALELYRLQEGALVLEGKSTADRPEVLASEVLPLTFRLVKGDPRPSIEVAHVDGVQRWSA